MSLPPDFARLRALAPGERKLLALALVLLAGYAAGVRLRGLRGVQGWFRGLKVPAGTTPAQATRLVAAAARRLPWKGGCLPAALTLQRLLRAQGLEAELELGVRKSHAGLEAHAWLVRDGAPLLDTRDAGEPFAALVPARRS